MPSWFSSKVYLDDQSRSILISGGFKKSTVEYFSPDNSLTGCSLPSLPRDRWGHSMNGMTICGGKGDNGHNCMTLGPRGWIKTHTLSIGRYGHVTWRRAMDILLMGGVKSGSTEQNRRMGTGSASETAEVAGDTGSAAKLSFAQLKYST